MNGGTIGTEPLAFLSRKNLLKIGNTLAVHPWTRALEVFGATARSWEFRIPQLLVSSISWSHRSLS